MAIIYKDARGEVILTPEQKKRIEERIAKRKQYESRPGEETRRPKK